MSVSSRSGRVSARTTSRNDICAALRSVESIWMETWLTKPDFAVDKLSRRDKGPGKLYRTSPGTQHPAIAAAQLQQIEERQPRLPSSIEREADRPRHFQVRASRRLIEIVARTRSGPRELAKRRSARTIVRFTHDVADKIGWKIARKVALCGR